MDSKSLSKQRYSQFASGYVNSDTHAKGYDLDRLVELANPQSDWIALDIATGGGHTALKFAPHVKQVVSSDLTPNMLAKAEEFILASGAGNVIFEVADAENLLFEDDAFDLVTCRIAPHHFPNIAQFVAESYRVLKVGGIMLLQDHVLPDDKDAALYVDEFERQRDPSHHRALSRVEWLHTFAQAGFTVSHDAEITKRHHFITWAERQGHGDDMKRHLMTILQDAPSLAQEWMQAQHIGEDSCSFVNHHIIIRAEKNE